MESKWIVERERLGLDYMVLMLQQSRLRWCWHVLREEDSDCVEDVWSVEWRLPYLGIDQGAWTEVMQGDCQARILNGDKGVAVDHGGWKRQMSGD